MARILIEQFNFFEEEKKTMNSVATSFATQPVYNAVEEKSFKSNPQTV
jgi:hypothetical protein